MRIRLWGLRSGGGAEYFAVGVEVVGGGGSGGGLFG